MGLYYDCEPDAYIFSQLLIDKQFQGQGYGKAAKKLYESFGFAETGRDEDEIIMKLEW